VHASDRDSPVSAGEKAASFLVDAGETAPGLVAFYSPQEWERQQTKPTIQSSRGALRPFVLAVGLDVGRAGLWRGLAVLGWRFRS
jgi:hypothetical protein